MATLVQNFLSHSHYLNKFWNVVGWKIVGCMAVCHVGGEKISNARGTYTYAYARRTYACVHAHESTCTRARTHTHIRTPRTHGSMHTHTHTYMYVSTGFQFTHQSNCVFYFQTLLEVHRRVSLSLFVVKIIKIGNIMNALLNSLYSKYIYETSTQRCKLTAH